MSEKITGAEAMCKALLAEGVTHVLQAKWVWSLSLQALPPPM